MSYYSQYSLINPAKESSNWPVISESITNYCNDHFKFKFDPGSPVVRLHEPTFSSEEILAVLEALLETRVTMGKDVKYFEELFAKYVSSSRSVTCNSGSSANLLAISALSNPKMPNHLKPGDEVIVPALSWSTTIWPIVQHGLIPVLVDVDLHTFNIDIEQIHRAITPKTKAIMLVHVYGNPCNMDDILSLAEKYSLFVIEDCCEALGAEYRGKKVGAFGDVGTFSFYYSHHITTMEGGILVTNNDLIADLATVIRAHGWIRDLNDKSTYIKSYPNIDPRFIFINHGYNLRLTEPQASMGIVQLSKLDQFVRVRRANTKKMTELFSQFELFNFQNETSEGYSSNFGFPMLLNGKSKFLLSELTKYMNDAGIETRPIICGNLEMQPAMSLFPHRVVGDLENATKIMNQGFSIGNHHFVDNHAIDYIFKILDDFINNKKI